MTNLKQLDAVECDTIYQEKGEFFFRKPGFRDAYGPFATEDEANEAAVCAGVIADGMDPITLMADAGHGRPDDIYDIRACEARIKELEGYMKVARERLKANNEHWNEKAKQELAENPVRIAKLRQRIDKFFRENPQYSRKDSEMANARQAGINQRERSDATNPDKAALQRRYQALLVEIKKLESGELTGDAKWKHQRLEAEADKLEDRLRDIARGRSDASPSFKKGDKVKNTSNGREGVVEDVKDQNGLPMVKIGGVWFATSDYRKDSDTEADAAVSFDKDNPEKPWSVKVGSSIKRFAFRQQAEAAARGDAEVDATVDKYIKSSGDRAKYLALTPEEKAKVNKWLEDGYYYPEAVKKAGIFNRSDADPVGAAQRYFANLERGSVFQKTDGSDADYENIAKKAADHFKVKWKWDPKGGINFYKDSAKADSTPTIVREGDQWIIVVTDGAEKSVFRLGVREYPTEAEAMEYATTNPQYTNNKPTSALDSLMAACDSLYAKADEVERRLDSAGDQRFSVVYINSADKEATIVVRAKHNVDAEKVAKENLGGELKGIRRVEQLPDRK